MARRTNSSRSARRLLACTLLAIVAAGCSAQRQASNAQATTPLGDGILAADSLGMNLYATKVQIARARQQSPLDPTFAGADATE